MPKLASTNRSTNDYPMSQADVDAHRESTHFRRPAQVDMSNLNGPLIREAAESGGLLELRDSSRPDVAPIILDDFLMAVMRGEIQ